MNSVNESENYPAALREILKRVIFEGKAKNQTEIATTIGVTKGQLSLAASKGIGLSQRIVIALRKHYGFDVYTYLENKQSALVESTTGTMSTEIEKRLIGLEAMTHVMLMKIVTLLSDGDVSAQKIFESLSLEIDQMAKLLAGQSRD